MEGPRFQPVDGSLYKMIDLTGKFIYF